MTSGDSCCEWGFIPFLLSAFGVERHKYFSWCVMWLIVDVLFHRSYPLDLFGVCIIELEKTTGGKDLPGAFIITCEGERISGTP